MSRTTIHKFPEQGPNEDFAEFRNSHRSAMFIWQAMFKRYIAKTNNDMEWGMYFMSSNGKMQQVWDLARKMFVPIDERIVMMTTFDKVLVRRSEISGVIDAMHEFERKYPGDSSILEQVSALEKLAQDETCFAVGWTQTSLSGDAWWVYEEAQDDSRRYDLSRDSDHWFLFDALEESYGTSDS